MTLSSRNISSLSKSDQLLYRLTRCCAVLSASTLLFIFFFLIGESIPAISKLGITRFFFDESWHPLSEKFNITAIIAGTLLTTVGAILIACPLGINFAVLIHFYCPKNATGVLQRMVELLAGIPSVVFGLWGLVSVAPIIANFGGSGQNILTATLILGIMILPTITLTASAALRAVPPEIVRGGASLGLSRSSIAIRLAIPAAWRGIKVGVFLAVARALGETMAVLMVAGNVVQFPNSLLSPVRTLTANIALEMGYATSGHRSVLFVSGLLLMILVSMIFFTIQESKGETDCE